MNNKSSYCFSLLGNAKGFSSSGQELRMKTKIYISIDIPCILYYHNTPPLKDPNTTKLEKNKKSWTVRSVQLGFV
jgi:hypothetical protein